MLLSSHHPVAHALRWHFRGFRCLRREHSQRACQYRRTSVKLPLERVQDEIRVGGGYVGHPDAQLTVRVRQLKVS